MLKDNLKDPHIRTNAAVLMRDKRRVILMPVRVSHQTHENQTAAAQP
jgi:hypothetical protein